MSKNINLMVQHKKRVLQAVMVKVSTDLWNNVSYSLSEAQGLGLNPESAHSRNCLH